MSQWSNIYARCDFLPTCSYEQSFVAKIVEAHTFPTSSFHNMLRHDAAEDTQGSNRNIPVPNRNISFTNRHIYIPRETYYFRREPYQFRNISVAKRYISYLNRSTSFPSRPICFPNRHISFRTDDYISFTNKSETKRNPQPFGLNA